MRRAMDVAAVDAETAYIRVVRVRESRSRCNTHFSAFSSRWLHVRLSTLERCASRARTAPFEVRRQCAHDIRRANGDKFQTGVRTLAENSETVEALLVALRLGDAPLIFAAQNVLARRAPRARSLLRDGGNAL